MLVLTRREGERIVIGEDVEICVVAIRGGRVQLGIEAPLSYRVRRSEIGAAPDQEASPVASTPVSLPDEHTGGLLIDFS